jgi:integrase
MSAPVITIFVRHGFIDGKPCKYTGDEFNRRCKCPKHLRWTLNGVQQRRKTGARAWDEAEKVKRRLEDQLGGSGNAEAPKDTKRFIADAIRVFVDDKRVQGVTPIVISKYTLELDRLRQFCERAGVFVVTGINRELLTSYAVTWAASYPSTATRAGVRQRVRSFLRYCYEAQWLDRIPALPSIKIDEPPTMPLTAEEYNRLLDALYIVNPRRWDGKLSTEGLRDKMLARVRAAIQLMRWSGLAVQDALTLRRSELLRDAKGFYRVVTSRQKTGTDVSVAIPKEVGEEILKAAYDDEYIFWGIGKKGRGQPSTLSKTWTNRYLRPLFDAAGIKCGHMVSHRLRDTFACDLLEKGVPLEEVSKLLGHESIRTTEKSYSKWVKGRQDRLDSLVTGTWGK